MAAAAVATDAGQPGGKRPEPPSLERLAAAFPQLEVIEFIGQGGMGAVYKARQKQLDRIVALKVLPPGIGGDPSFAERFTREAKALAKLLHPNIVTLFEFGQADGIYYLLMEYVDGVSLGQLLRASRVSSREALAIVPQICDALQYAHDHGIVHRDIKPENILLDRRGKVKVADFGLAKLVDANAPLTPSLSPLDGERVAGRPGEGRTPDLTDAGKIMGTPAYMAPEQVEHPGEVDHRADIYALGVVFYQMLTGELPGKRFEPPSSKVQIDVRLDEVVLRALETNPKLRYQQVSVLKTQVETIATDMRSATAPPTGTSAKVGAGQATTLCATKKKKGELIGIGCAFQALGIACFFIPYVGLFLGIILLLLGGHMALKLLCSHCGKPTTREARICTTCGAHFLPKGASARPSFGPAGVAVGSAIPGVPPAPARGRNYRSQQTLLGLPLVHVAWGVDPATGRPRVAKGILAVGPVAYGVIAVGFSAWGLFPCGLVACGFWATGLLAVGFWSVGLAAAGFQAVGLLALGSWHTVGLVAAGPSPIGLEKIVVGKGIVGLLFVLATVGACLMDRLIRAIGSAAAASATPQKPSWRVWFALTLIPLALLIMARAYLPRKASVSLPGTLALSGDVNTGLPQPREFSTRLAQAIHVNTNTAGFGPVIERMVNLEFGTNWAIDLDSGRLMDGRDGVEEQGADAAGLDFLPISNPTMIGLCCINEAFAMLVDATNWDNGGADWVRSRADKLPFGVKASELPAVTMSMMCSEDGELPSTYLFKTREGGRGILQITGFTENPPAVKIRYKLVLAQASPVPISSGRMLLPADRTQPSDEQIRHKILGTWILDDDHAKTIEHKPDGSFVTHEGTELTAEGTWQVKDGFIVATVTNASSPNAILEVESNKVVSIDDYNVVVVTSQGGTNLVTAHKR
jgi:predicted Ser/Thr protein kinase